MIHTSKIARRPRNPTHSTVCVLTCVLRPNFQRENVYATEVGQIYGYNTNRVLSLNLERKNTTLDLDTTHHYIGDWRTLIILNSLDFNVRYFFDKSVVIGVNFLSAPITSRSCTGSDALHDSEGRSHLCKAVDVAGQDIVAGSTKNLHTHIHTGVRIRTPLTHPTQTYGHVPTTHHVRTHPHGCTCTYPHTIHSHTPRKHTDTYPPHTTYVHTPHVYTPHHPHTHGRAHTVHTNPPTETTGSTSSRRTPPLETGCRRTDLERPSARGTVGTSDILQEVPRGADGKRETITRITVRQ